jgi:hypothetical protein
MKQFHGTYEVNDHVIMLHGELTGCTGKVTTVGSGGLLVVKPDPPEHHPPIVISDECVHLRDMAKQRK